MHPAVRPISLAFALLGVALGGCGKDAAPAKPHHPPGPHGCEPGESVTESGACQAAGLPADMPCAPGESNASGSCLAAGVPPDLCGQGFEADGAGACTPILPAKPCAKGTMAIPGETQCRDVGPCGAGAWPDVPAGDPAQYVDVGYTGADSDGSATRPWTGIQSAVDASPSGGVVAVAPGSYDGYIDIAKPVRIWGVCAGKVELTRTSGTIVWIGTGADGTELRDVALSGGAGAVVSGAEQVVLERIWIHDTGSRALTVQDQDGPTSAELVGSLIEGAKGAGLGLIGAEASVESSVIRATAADGSGYGAGVATDNDPNTGARAKLTIHGALVEQNHGFGISVLGGDATVGASSIRDTAPDTSGTTGWGIAVRNEPGGARGTLTLEDSTIERSHEAGVSIVGSDAVLTRVVIRDTQPKPEGTAGVGMRVSSQGGQPAHAEIRSSVIERNHAVGIILYGADALLDGAVVRDTETDTAGHYGHGIEIRQNVDNAAPSTVTVQSSVVERNLDRGILISGSDATVDSTVVRDTGASSDDASGWGVSVYSEPATARRSQVTVSASLVERNQEVGVAVLDSDATIDACVVRQTQPAANGWYGRGLVFQGANATARATLIEDNHEMGVLVVGPGATLDGLVVRGTLAAGDGRLGDGISVAAKAGVPTTTLITGALVENSARAALSNFGATVTFGASHFACSGFSLEGEEYSGAPFEFKHLGGNACGCPPTDECQVLSAGLSAPEPVAATPPSSD